MNSNDCSKFVKMNDDAVSFINYMVNKYGDVLMIDTNKSYNELLPNYHHDYFYFCLTKATRSLLASNKLANMRFREDAMILARTAYETYLLMANVINDEDFVIKSVCINLLLSTGEATYFKEKNGRIDFHKVVLKDTNKPLDYDMSISTLSKKTFSNYDKFIHKELYKYMSEFLHSDFMSSGNYRTDNDKKYDVEPMNIYLDIHFIIMYITYLLLQSMYLELNRYKEYMFNQIEVDEMSELNALLNKLVKYLDTILNDLDFRIGSSNFKDMISKRIREKII